MARAGDPGPATEASLWSLTPASGQDPASASLQQELFDALRADGSEHAIGADDDTLWWLCEAAQIGESDQTPLTTQAQRASNWKHWAAYCDFLQLRSSWRPDAASLDGLGMRREAAIWAGALGWIYARMKPRRGKFLPPGPPHFGRPKPPQTTSPRKSSST